MIPVATLVLTLSIGSAAFAGTGSSSTPSSASGTSTAVTSTDSTAAGATTQPSAPAGTTVSNPWGNQRSDETLLTGDILAQVNAIALAQVGSDATIVRIETDSDATAVGHAACEAHIVKADGTAVTVYVDNFSNYVGTESQPAGGPGGCHDAGHSSTSSCTGTSSSQDSRPFCRAR